MHQRNEGTKNYFYQRQWFMTDPSLCRAGGCWWWIPVAGPMVGGAVGAGVYFLFIELHHPESIQENHVQDKYEIATMS